MAKCDVPSCQNEVITTIEDLSLSVCDWHAYEHEHELGWIGKIDDDNINNIIPKIKDTGNNEDK